VPLPTFPCGGIVELVKFVPSACLVSDGFVSTLGSTAFANCEEWVPAVVVPDPREVLPAPVPVVSWVPARPEVFPVVVPEARPLFPAPVLSIG
jgi:hypothetical protein